MRTASLERITAVAGLLTVALYVAASLVATAGTPASDDPAGDFGAYFAQHRTTVLVAAYAIVAASAVALGFLAGLRDVLRRLDERGESTLATTGLLAGALQMAMVVAGVCLLAAAAYRPGQAPEALRTLSDAGWVVINLGAGIPTAVSVGAFSLVLHRARVAPAPVVGLGLAVAAAHLVVSGAFAAGGFLSPQGAISVIVPGLYYAWVVVVSLWLVRRRMPATAT